MLPSPDSSSNSDDEADSATPEPAGLSVSAMTLAEGLLLRGTREETRTKYHGNMVSIDGIASGLKGDGRTIILTDSVGKYLDDPPRISVTLSPGSWEKCKTLVFFEYVRVKGQCIIDQRRVSLLDAEIEYAGGSEADTTTADFSIDGQTYEIELPCDYHDNSRIDWASFSAVGFDVIFAQGDETTFQECRHEVSSRDNFKAFLIDSPNVLLWEMNPDQPGTAPPLLYFCQLLKFGTSTFLARNLEHGYAKRAQIEKVMDAVNRIRQVEE